MKWFYTLALGFCFIHYSYGQNDLTESKTFINDSYQKVLNDPGLIISNQGLNVFFAKKVSTYLSGASDLSLFSSYAILDVADKTLFIGQNIAKDPYKKPNRVKLITTIGLKASSDDDFATIYSGKSLANNIGILAKITFLGRGLVKFDDKNQWQNNLVGRKKTLTSRFGHKDWMNVQRTNIIKDITEQADEAARKFENSISTIGPGDFVKNLRKEYYEQANADLKKKYLDAEAVAISDQKSHYSFFDHWLSFEIYIPVTSSRYVVAESLLSKIDTAKLYNFSLTAKLNGLWDGQNGTVFANIGAGIKNNNGILTENFKKYNLLQYKQLGGTDTLSLAQLSSSEVNVGFYETFITTSLSAQVVFFPTFTKGLAGVSTLIEKNFGKYNPLNLKLGIPFRISGESAEKPVTFEIQGKWNDFNGDIDAKTSRSDKFTVGFSIGIPFSSRIY